MACVCLCGCKDRTPRADHVVYMCFDAMSAIGMQRAETPNFNYMIGNGAVSIHTRCGLPSNSSPNWMTVASAAPFEMTGVLDNGVSPRNGTVEPALKNAIGFFPTIFEAIREQRPDSRIYFFGESTWATGMYDMTPFDVVVPEQGTLTPDDAIHRAADAFVSDRPDIMFIEIDDPDYKGHTWGHENQGYLDCLHHMDEHVGDFVRKLEDAGLMKNTVIVITADHGGFNFGHGGSTMAELEVPVIMYGGPVTKGKVMEHVNMNYDVPATVAGLLGVELPSTCTVRAIACKDGSCSIEAGNFLYAAMPEGQEAVSYKLYRKVYDEALPDFARLGRPDAEGVMSTFCLEDLPVSPDEDDFAVLFTARVNIARAGSYEFELSSDDGSKLYVDGKLCVRSFLKNS